jgi:hypothetical protein
MIYLIYLLLVPIDFLFTYLVAYPLAPILPLFAVQKEWWCDNHSYRAVGPVLPSWLNVFMTPDNTLDGDAGAIARNGIGYWAKVKWLWRNAAYSFALRYLTKPYSTQVCGDTSIKDNDNAKEGWCLVTANGLFQFRLVRRILSTNRCFYVNFGWNVIGLVDPNVNPKPDTWQATFVFSPRISGFR